MERKQQATNAQLALLAEQNKLMRAQLEAFGSSARLAALVSGFLFLSESLNTSGVNPKV